ncbi:hypothetical protein [Nocardia ignorata]|uniref:Secreted protein n=1 Tax=Nocardia ignorata TaxID=145285 RepID=A0A4V3CMK1_NOCIG|nr:hypothetical protein [Nocardia ignorata]TDP29844.1 hypothetical protein DFR75_112113 [Nocardia ignorata]
MAKPLLYLDVDGPLNPYAAKPERRPTGYDTHRLMPAAWLERHPNTPPDRVKPLRVWLNPAHGPALLALADVFELVWATTWEHEANEFIGPLIGLPELPVVEWAEGRPKVNRAGVYWKTPQLIEHAAGRPFAWVDDEIGRYDREFVSTYHGRAALLHYVGPAKGLLDEDFAVLREWGNGQTGVAGSAA